MTNTSENKHPKVLALGLDGPNHELLLRWMEEGRLPRLKALRHDSLQISIESEKKYSNEHCWIPILTGQSREHWPHWMDDWDANSYQFNEASIFDWLQAPLFYALGERRQVISFDLTAPVVEGVTGIQVSGWATELNECYPNSSPPEFFAELVARHGRDPKLVDSHSIASRLSSSEGVSYAIPCLYQPEAMAGFIENLKLSIKQRTNACLDLLHNQPWDLFISMYSETHAAGHILWHLSQEHPLNELRQSADPLLQIYQAIDASVGEIIDAVDDDVTLVFFTIDAMVPDCLENARAVFLPEFIYRWNFPGKTALAPGDYGAPVPTPRMDYSQHWKHEIWRLRTATGNKELASPEAQEASGDPLSWCPANWYAPLWPGMKAIVMPSVADGYIRLNVKGREGQGIVDEEDFLSVCNQLRHDLNQLVNARTGKAMVREIIQVRDNPFELNPKDPPADLIVVFREDCPVDAVEAPTIGRIGPVPYFRSASHQAHGGLLKNLMYISGQGIEPGESSQLARLEDIPATLLKLLGQPLPDNFDGVSQL